MKTIPKTISLKNSILQQSMVKYYMAMLCCILLVGPVWGQKYGNEWIDFSNNGPYSNQQYFKFKILNEGIYRISAEDLIAAGVNVKTSTSPGNQVDIRTIQLIRNGKQVPVYMYNASTGLFLAGGYMEFYAKGNDGWVDKELYVKQDGTPDPQGQATPDYSLYTDSATYYITWNNKLDNLRFELANDMNYSNYTASPWCAVYANYIYPQTYYDGFYDVEGIPDPEYTAGEGYLSAPFQTQGAQTSIFKPSGNLPVVKTVNFVANANYKPILSTVVVGASNDLDFYDPIRQSAINHHLNIKVNNKMLLDTFFNAFGVITKNYQLSTSDLVNGDNTIYISSNWPNNAPRNDRKGVGYLSLSYPRSYNFLDDYYPIKIIGVPDGVDQDKALVEFTDLYTNGKMPVMYDLDNNKKLIMSMTGNKLRGLLPNSGGVKKCIIVTADAVNTLTSAQISPVSSGSAGYARFINYRNYSENNKNYLILTQTSLLAPAKDYATYRSSNYSVGIIDVETLYDQFAYGVRKHPLAIRHFMDQIMQAWEIKPEHLLILGKSIAQTECRYSNALSQQNLVPTMGKPEADNLLVARIQGTGFAPSVAVGRVSARTPQQAYDYLQKVKEYESNEPAPWMKEIIQLSGGDNDAQASEFSQYLTNYGAIMADSLFGGHATLFAKRQVGIGPIQNYAQRLKELVEEGASLIEFFGHSSKVLFDNSLDDPQNYNIKKGRYSFFISNGCYSGDIHASDGSNSELYVLTPDKGSIAFVAASYLAKTTGLNPYNSNLHYNLGTRMYGQSVGRCIQQAVKDLDFTPSIDIKQVCLEMNLEGDPAIVMNAHQKPDLLLEPAKLFTTPSNIQTDIDSFTLNIGMANIGRTFDRDFYVSVKRTYGDNSGDTTYRVLSKPVYYRDTLHLVIPVDKRRGPGQNTFLVMLDADDVIDEKSSRHPNGEANNQASLNVFIQTKDVLTVNPPQFAIVDSKTVKLVAVTNNYKAPVNTYTIELDTTELFNSAAYRNTDITSNGGILTWQPTIDIKDSVVYYWRASIKGSGNWSNSSFTYIKGRTGWNQSHYYQFNKDKIDNMRLNPQTRQTEFIDQVVGVRAVTHNNAYGKDYNKFCGYFENNVRVVAGTYVANGYIAIVFDNVTGKKVQSIPDGNGSGQFGDVHPGTSPFDFFNFNMTNDNAPNFANRCNNLQAFLSSIPNNYYLMLYSINNPGKASYPPGLVNEFKKFGIANITTIPDSVPYILFGKKGGNKPNQSIGKMAADVVYLNDSVKYTYTQGQLTSSKIGPSLNWSQFSWRQRTLDKPQTKDITYVNIYGVKDNGQEQLLIGSLPPDSSLVNLSNRISAKDFPYLKLQAFTYDTTNRTPAQLINWRVYYNGVPEASVNTAQNFSFSKDTVNEGDPITLTASFSNISAYNMDSVRLKMYYIDRNNVSHVFYNKKRKPLLATGNTPNDTLNVQLEINTRGLPGKNQLVVFLNPDKDQPEQYDFNNFLNIPFFVKTDNVNPLLDVTFDGVHILNGDIISPKPAIQIRLKDENKYLVLNDTSKFKVYLLPPHETYLPQFQLHFNNPSNPNTYLKFTPGTATNNTAVLDYAPTLTYDGVYTLIVEATDMSGNQSGKNKYSITFEVVNRSSITNVMNYPNPFSTSTRFVFVLTGTQNDIPQDMKIQIMTVSGKIVREITKSELGDIKIGRNITQYAWDGKDEYGDLLANGVYLYRVITNLRGSEIEKSSTNADSYFNNGYGKMVILR